MKICRPPLLALTVTLTACGAGPSPVVTPSPTPYPSGTPSATALENVPLVVGLEKTAGRPGRLVMISASGLTPGDGRISEEDRWSYVFADANLDLFRWTVRPQGEVVFEGRTFNLLNLEMADIQARIRIDSDEAVAIALRNGGQRFVDRYPNARALGNCRDQRAVLTWQLSFLDFSGGTLCRPEFWINAIDGRMLARNVSCVE